MMNVLVDFRLDTPGLARLHQMADGRIDIVEMPAEEGPRPLPPDRLDDVHVLLCTFPPANLEEMPKLRFIQIGSTGYAQLVGLGLSERGIRACNGRGVFDIPIAEWNIAMMVNLVRDLRGMIRNQDEGVWDRSSRFQGTIQGMVLGIWGYGGIGRQTARLAKAMGLTVHVLARGGIKKRTNIYCVTGSGDPEGLLPNRIYGPGQTAAFLRDLDFLLLALPLTRATEGIVGETELRGLRPTAFLLNPARGPLVQEAALLRALRDGWIAGAALDTHYHYPMPPDHPLWRMPSVIMTPHISGSSGGAYYLPGVWDIFTQNVARLKQDLPLLNELTAAELAGE